MTQRPLQVTYLTSGAAGMYCGSCLHDNTLARALIRAGVDVQLLPTYTPIRTDEQDISADQVFFGGITIYLQQKMPLLRYLPKTITRLLDQPRLIKWATSRGVQTSARDLGALTVSMLQGTHGRQRSEVEKLVTWLATSAHPDLIVFSNILIGGCIPSLKQRLRVPVIVTLQGDDIFLDSLPEPYQSRAVSEIRRLVSDVDLFLVNSRFYADEMGERLGIPAHKIRIVPLGIDTTDFTAEPPPRSNDQPPTIGYLARLAPEKGLHLLVDAFIRLAKRPGMERVQLKIAGWLGEHNRNYADEQWNALRIAGLSDRFEYVGSVDRPGKVKFLHNLDLFSVPTVYREPKGLFVLEALAAGVPVVLPEHGAFPELLDRYGSGLLVPPNDATALADALESLLRDEPRRQQLAAAARTAAMKLANADEMARNTQEVFQSLLSAKQ